MCYPRILRIIIIDYALDAYLGGPHFFAAGLASACSELFSWIKKNQEEDRGGRRIQETRTS